MEVLDADFAAIRYSAARGNTHGPSNQRFFVQMSLIHNERC